MNTFFNGSLQMSFNTIKCIVKDRSNGMLNDELLDLFIDSINLHNGFESNELPNNPPIYAVPVFGIMQLFKVGECHPNNQYNLSLDDENFDMKLKNYVSLGYMSSSIGTLMHQYRTRKDDKITKFYGILHINNNHFVSVFIDIEQRTVETCDSYHTGKGFRDFSADSGDDSESKEDQDTETVVLMRKWIAKSMSIIDYSDLCHCQGHFSNRNRYKN